MTKACVDYSTVLVRYDSIPVPFFVPLNSGILTACGVSRTYSGSALAFLIMQFFVNRCHCHPF